MPFMLFKHNNNVTKINFFLLKTSKGQIILKTVF